MNTSVGTYTGRTRVGIGPDTSTSVDDHLSTPFEVGLVLIIPSRI